jgi:hypothetical protein
LFAFEGTSFRSVERLLCKEGVSVGEGSLPSLLRIPPVALTIKGKPLETISSIKAPEIASRRIVELRSVAATAITASKRNPSPSERKKLTLIFFALTVSVMSNLP